MSKGSLSATLSGLLRAQHGSALDDVEDSDLDKRIAEIMVKDAKERQKQWGTMGFTAYIDDMDDADGPSRKTNKRFLASMIRNVDTHNQALIQQELEAAQSADKQRRKDDRSRLFGSAMQSASRSKSDKGKQRVVEEEEWPVRRHDERSPPPHRRRDRSQSPRDSRRRHREVFSDDSDYRREKEERRRRRHRLEREEDSYRSSRHRRRTSDENRGDEADKHRREERDSSSRRHRHRESSSRRADREAEEHRAHTHPDRSRGRHSARDVPEETGISVEPTKVDNRADVITIVKPAAESASQANDSSRAEGDDQLSNGVKKLSKRQMQDLHPTELFMLTGGTSIEASPSPPPESRPRKRKARTPSPIARVRAPSEEEPDPGPGIRPPPTITEASSKMDKYFQATYDPRIDVNYDDMVDPVTGFIKEGAYDDWELMREVQKQQREYKKEKGMREAEERFQAQEREAAKKKAKERAADEEKDRKRRRKLGIDSDEDEYGPQPATKTKEGGYTAPAGPGMFGYRYVKKGGTREWDLGKETPT